MANNFNSDINSKGKVKSGRQGLMVGTFDTMPTPSDQYENITVQFIGVTSVGGFVKGSFYICKKQSDNTYLWETNNPPSSSTSITDYELTIPITGWTVEGEFQVCTVALTGMTATQYPIVAVYNTATTIAEIQEVQESASHILKSEPVANGIKFYADDVPTKAIPILVKVMA